MKVLEELNKINEARSPSDSLAELDKREAKRLKEIEILASKRADKWSKQARGLQGAWLEALAKARVLDLASNLAGSLVADKNFLETTKEDLGVGDITQVRPENLLRDLADLEKDNAIDFVNDDGLEGSLDVDLNKAFIKAITKVKV